MKIDFSNVYILRNLKLQPFFTLFVVVVVIVVVVVVVRTWAKKILDMLLALPVVWYILEPSLMMKLLTLDITRALSMD